MNDKINTNEFRESLDRHLSDMKADPFLAQRIIASEKEERPVKKKFSFAVVLAVAVLVIGAAVAIAEIVGINVFELFGKTDNRYAELAPYTVLNDVSEVSVSSVELGETKASINSAYYDGQSLIIGYLIQNGSRMEEFVPDEELLGKMTKCDPTIMWAASNDAEAELIARMKQAKADKTPMGIVSYTVYPSDHTVTKDGVDIPPYLDNSKKGDDSIEYTIREYESPLVDEIQNLDSLDISIRLYQSVSYLYFDGTSLYTYSEVIELTPMRAIVWNSHVPTNLYSGSGEYNGIKMNAVAHVSAANVVLEIRFDQTIPAVPDYDHWYVFRLTDESGTVLRENEGSNGDEEEVVITYQGTGTLPQELTLSVYMENEGEFDLDETLMNTEPIILRIQK